MGRIIGVLLVVAAVIVVAALASNAQPFGPPLYIANPSTMECRYYFAGDERHFNPRPENYTLNIGYTTEFKNQDQACEFWRCIYTNGTVKVTPDNRPIEKDLCVCGSGQYWDDIKGCVEFKQQEGPKTFLGLIWGWITGIFS